MWPELLTEIPEPRSIYSFHLCPILWVQAPDKIRFGEYVVQIPRAFQQFRSIRAVLIFNFDSSEFFPDIVFLKLASAPEKFF
ncbi:MAG: hypothetical protein Ct9H300mP28_05420 [Pseudomonadota bacterium]|nr:MAG: hypothetical protein Ct9H300mP28_05420 [Pseudomonadota bacterium]